MAIKIGKANYDPIELWSFSNEIVDEAEPLLDPLYNTYEKLKEETNEVTKELKPIVERMSQLEGQDKLTEDEENEYSSCNGWVDELAFKYQLKRKAICQSFIIVVSTLLKPKVQSATSIYHRIKANEKRTVLCEALLNLGPTTKLGVPWAKGVTVAGNYVRHSDEWRVYPHRKIELGGEVYWQEIPDPKSLSLKGMMQKKM